MRPRRITPVGMVRIVGLQARYFLCVWLALLPALAVLLRKTIRPTITEEKAEAAITPLCEVAPGVVLSQFTYGGRVWNLISKSGSFGGKTLFWDVQRTLSHWKAQIAGRT